MIVLYTIKTGVIIANEHTAESEEKRHQEIEYVKKASFELQNLLGSVHDKEARKKIERVYDALCSSPVKSHPQMARIENHILQSINELKNAVFAENKEKATSIANSLLATVDERNMRLKSLYS